MTASKASRETTVMAISIIIESYISEKSQLGHWTSPFSKQPFPSGWTHIYRKIWNLSILRLKNLYSSLFKRGLQKDAKFEKGLVDWSYNLG